MNGQISYTSYDYTPMDIIPVIASFDSDGHIKPLFVRINGESYKVHSSWVRKGFTGSTEFNCKIIDRDYLKPIVITYHRAEGVWTIPRHATPA